MKQFSMCKTKQKKLHCKIVYHGQKAKGSSHKMQLYKLNSQESFLNSLVHRCLWSMFLLLNKEYMKKEKKKRNTTWQDSLQICLHKKKERKIYNVKLKYLWMSMTNADAKIDAMVIATILPLQTKYEKPIHKLLICKNLPYTE